MGYVLGDTKVGLVGDPSTDPSEQRGASSGDCYHRKGQSMMMETCGVSHGVRQGLLQLRHEGGKQQATAGGKGSVVPAGGSMCMGSEVAGSPVET